MALRPLADQTPNVQFITDLAQVDAYGDDWDRLVDGRSTYFPSYDDARTELKDLPFFAAVHKDGGCVRGLAVFVNQGSADQFAIGERQLFSVPVRETRLYGGGILGDFSEAELNAVLRRASNEWRCDLLTIGEVGRQSPLIPASAQLPGMAPIRRTRHDPVRWLIPLPPTFDDYLGCLRPTTRKSIAYAMRHFARECPVSHETFTRPSQVDEFLSEAESISRKTYQWDVGDRLINDAPTRFHYRRLAEQGRFRGYLLRVAGEPCAFAYGKISGRIFLYQTPGFDPRWRRYSPGLVLLALAIQDVIERGECEHFDFGLGGDAQGYKARFGTFAIPSVWLQFARWTRPRGAALLLGHSALALVKGAASGLVRDPRLRQGLRKAIRRYGGPS